MEKLVEIEIGAGVDSWDLYDLPTREACVKNLEALLCRQVRAGEDITKTLEVLFYFQSVREKLEHATDNAIDADKSSLKYRLRIVREKFAIATRDAFAITGFIVVLTALLGLPYSECNVGGDGVQRGGQTSRINHVPSGKVGSYQN